MQYTFQYYLEQYQFFYSLGLLIAGGTEGLSTELLNLETLKSCNLPNLPRSRWYATAYKDMICGGWDTPQECLSFSPTDKSWNVTQKLPHFTRGHTSWVIKEGIILLGGWDEPASTSASLWKPDGSIQELFKLQTKIR